jgi:hypothetical protein
MKISRRLLIISCAANALSVGLALPAFSAPSGKLAKYYGNPNVVATAVYIDGIGSVAISMPGTGGAPANKVYNGVALRVTAGSGVGAIADIWVDKDGGVSFVSIVSPGKHFAVGDTFTASPSDIGATGFIGIVKTVGIACSRADNLTIKSPGFVHVSASGVSADGTNPPYSGIRHEDLEYSWDFGDVSGAENLMNPYSGVRENMNSDQIGGEAAYCYRKPGAYTITLSIRWWNGLQYRATTTTLRITVVNFEPSSEWYFNSTQQGRGDASSPSNASASLKLMNAKLLNSNTRINIERGSRWTDQGEIVLATGVANLRIGAYGAGNNPIIEQTSATAKGECLYISRGSKADIVFSNIDFHMTGSTVTSSVIFIYCAPGSQPMRNLYWDNCNIYVGPFKGEVQLSAVYFAADHKSSDYGLNCLGWWGGSQLSDSPTVSGWGGAVFSWIFRIGVTITGSGHPIFDHHIYTGTNNHELIAYANFPQKSTRLDAIKLAWNDNWSDGSANTRARYQNVRDCFISGTPNGTDTSWSNVGTVGRFVNTVFERLSFSGLTGTDAAVAARNAETQTIRDCKMWSCKNGTFCSGEAKQIPNNSLSVYRNEIYALGATYSRWLIDFNPDSGPYKGLQQVTDNIVYDPRKPSALFRAKPSDMTGSLVDRNHYYSPNYSLGWENYATPVDFATWQRLGFDKKGAVAKPDWVDPANGKFSDK